MAKAKKRPVRATAWMHTLDNTEGLRGNKPVVELTFSKASPFGIPGEAPSLEYPVTRVPLYTRDALSRGEKHAD